MAERLKLKFLTVIWGARYIEEFARVSLPSYLAEGNLPHLAAETDLEVLVMTSSASLAAFEEQPAFARLRSLCPVRFILIDDLITTGIYGVTLTLAYARGIMDSGEEQTNTHFVFMNADFVLASGSLATMLAALREGHRCVMAPSLRASAETTLPGLAAALDVERGVLQMAPRPMVQLAFENLHPTVVAKTITQKFVTCSTHNQLYWQVDDTTLLGRSHLIFMLAIRPEVPMRKVNSYCDYGFVPELVPSGAFTLLGDSDRFFMLELQPVAQEKDFLYCGASTPEQMAAELSVWTTAEHRRFATVDTVFHAGDLPDRLAETRDEATAFVSALHARMVQPAVSHAHHFYWEMGVQAWRQHRQLSTGMPAEPPPEVDTSMIPAPTTTEQASAPATPPRRSLRSRYVDLIALGRRLNGAVPNVPPWHHLWLDFRPVLDWASALKRRPGQRSLLICEADSALPVAFEKVGSCDVVIGLDGFAETCAAQTGDAQPFYDNVILNVTRARVRDARRILETALTRARPGARVLVFIEHPNSDLDPSDFSRELAQYVENVLPSNWLDYRITARFAGGRAKRVLRQMERRIYRYLHPSSRARLPLLFAAMAAWPCVALLTAVNNYRLRRATDTCPPFCSSVLLMLDRESGNRTGQAARV